METKVNELVYGFELIEKQKEAIKLAVTTIEENDWQINGDIDLLKKFSMSEYQHMSKTSMKRLNRYCNWLIEKPNMGNIKRLFHFLCTNVFNTSKRVKVIHSVREMEIKAARKSWKDVHEVEQELLKRYKETKGDFYK